MSPKPGRTIRTSTPALARVQARGRSGGSVPFALLEKQKISTCENVRGTDKGNQICPRENT
jgi:hypothetical protein